MGFALERSDLGNETSVYFLYSCCDVEETDKIASEDFKYFNLSEVLFYLFGSQNETFRGTHLSIDSPPKKAKIIDVHSSISGSLKLI